MVVKIRLARFGRTNAPFYNIVVAHARTARNSRPLEVIGTYDPVPRTDSYQTGRKHKNIELDRNRAMYWIGVGAQPSEPIRRLLSYTGITEPKYRPPVTHLTDDKLKALEKEKEAEAQRQLALRAEARRTPAEQEVREAMEKMAQEESNFLDKNDPRRKAERRVRQGQDQVQDQEHQRAKPTAQEAAKPTKGSATSKKAEERRAWLAQERARARDELAAQKRDAARKTEIRKFIHLRTSINQVNGKATSLLRFLEKNHYPHVFKVLRQIFGKEKADEVEAAHEERLIKSGPRKTSPGRRVAQRARRTLNYGNDLLIKRTLRLLDNINRPLDQIQEQTRPLRTASCASPVANVSKTKIISLRMRSERVLQHARDVFIPEKLEYLAEIIGPQKAAEVADAYYQQEGVEPRRDKKERDLLIVVHKLERALDWQDNFLIPVIRHHIRNLM